MDDAVPEFWNAGAYRYVLQGGYRARNRAIQQWLRDNASPSRLQKAAVCLESGRVVVPLQDVGAAILSAPAVKASPSTALTSQVQGRSTQSTTSRPIGAFFCAGSLLSCFKLVANC